MDDVKRLTREITNELRKRGVEEFTPALKRQIAQCASDEAMVERVREALNNSEKVDIDLYMKLKASALASRVALLGEDQIGPTKLEIEYIRPGGETAPLKWIDELRDERNRLREENEALRSEIAALRAQFAATRRVLLAAAT